MLKNKTEYCETLINFLGDTHLAVNMLFVTRNKQNNSYEVYSGNLSQEVGNNLRELCLKISKRSYGKPEKKSFALYDPSMKFSECTEFLDQQKIQEIKPMLDMVAGKSIDLKKLDEKFLDNLWFYVIQLGNGNKQIMFFKKYSKGMVLTKGIGIALAFKSGDFDKLKHDIFMIEDKIDCIYFNNCLIIRSKGNFEKIFDFFKQIKENAKSAIKFIEEKLPFEIENFNIIKSELMEHEIKIRKLNNIYTTRTLEKIETKNIELLIKDGTLRNISIKEGNNGKMIVVSTDPWEILKILDDDFVKSRLTDINYEATHKKRK